MPATFLESPAGCKEGKIAQTLSGMLKPLPLEKVFV